MRTIGKAYRWWLLGIFGCHRFYLGKTISGSVLLACTLFWLYSFLIGKESFGILSLADYLGPIERFLLNLGGLGKILSTAVYGFIFGFPVLWWLSDVWRIPRWVKRLKAKAKEKYNYDY